MTTKDLSSFTDTHYGDRVIVVQWVGKIRFLVETPPPHIISAAHIVYINITIYINDSYSLLCYVVIIILIIFIYIILYFIIMVQIYRPENQSAVLITFIIKQKKPF